MTTGEPTHGLLLTPGAGASKDNRTLVAVEHAVDPLPVRRIDFAYRAAGRRIPDRPEQAIATISAECESFREQLRLTQDRILLGGRSYGGRMCSMAVATGLPAAGLVLLSYPLHPPGRPDRLRTEHFPDLAVPCLFVSGSSDPFGSPAEFDAALAAIPGPVTVVRFPGGHDVRGGDAKVGAAVREWIGQLG